MLITGIGFVFTALVASVTAFTNPIKDPNGSDPHMVYSNGYYYLTSTTWSDIRITRATTVGGLKTATPKVVWTDSMSTRCCNVWAPEIHFTFGKWHIYYSAGTRGAENQHSHVLEASGSTIWDSTWRYLGQVSLAGSIWAIDGSILNYNGLTYFLYSAYRGAIFNSEQSLWIVQLSSAYQVTGSPVEISRPTLSWEKVTAAVNEGAAVIQRNGRTWVVYSASHCSGTGYKLGQLELTGTNPLVASSWTKNPNPVFVAANGQYQPGHNGFFTSPNGTYWNVYHANHNTPGACDGSRYTAVQPVNWNSDGTPNFGQPRPLSENIPEPQ